MFSQGVRDADDDGADDAHADDDDDHLRVACYPLRSSRRREQGHAIVMMRLRAGCPLFWLRVEPG